ncbi:MAG TPA: hypothetical protein VM733_03235 [Thermoanaerobaculia bacterium]|nr:hypothetical protein [Thermoanaerobaculia bacterium]
MRRLLLLLSCVACATPRPQRFGCTQFEGMYIFDPKLCRVSHAALPLNVVYEMFPDGGMLPDEPTMIGVHQDGCSNVSMAMYRRAFALDGAWRDGALTSDDTHRSNLPAPIAIGSTGTYYWRLARESDTTLLYTTGYRERGLFVLIPYYARVSTTCRLTASPSSASAPLPAPPPRR